MAKFTNIEIRDRVLPALREIGAKPVPVGARLKLVRVLRDFQQHLMDVEMVRLSLTKQWGDKDEKGNLILDENGNTQFKQDETARAAFSAGFSELMHHGWDYPDTITIEDLGDTSIAENVLADLGALLEISLDEIKDAKE